MGLVIGAVVVVLAAAGGFWLWSKQNKPSPGLRSGKKKRKSGKLGKYDKALLEAASQGVADQFVVGPYLIDVAVDGDRIKPARYREHIRATGPTTMEA